MPQLQLLKSQIAHANQIYAAGVDEDWKRSCMEYPKMLDYYFSLVEAGLPDEEESCVREPMFGGAGGNGSGGARKARRGSAGQSVVGQRRRERRRSRGRTKTPPRAPSVGKYMR